MAENFNLIFGSQSPATASWSDADYQTGWNVVGSTPPTAEQFDALQNRSDKKAQELNNRMLPLEQKAEEQGRQAGTAYAVGAAVTVDGLPADWLLVCTTPGTSGTIAITLPDPLLDGATINDGTITWTLRKIATNGSLGYRQPNTTYTAGQIKYHSALPTGWYLECTTPGTSSSGELTISSPSIGGTVTDGTVTWTVSKDYKNQNNSNKTDINNFVDDGYYAVAGFNDAPFYGYPGCILVYRIRNSADEIQTYQLAMTLDQVMAIRSRTNAATWRPWINITTDVNSERIVAKSLGANGYIKYASGLIMQWMHIDSSGQSQQYPSFPIAFTAQPCVSALLSSAQGDEYVGIPQITKDGFTLNTPSIAGTIHIIAIGY